MDLPDLPEEEEPEVLPELGDTVPAGWLDMTTEAGYEAGVAADSFPLSVDSDDSLDPILGLLGPDEKDESGQAAKDSLGAVNDLFGDVGVSENNGLNGQLFGGGNSDG